MPTSEVQALLVSAPGAPDSGGIAELLKEAVRAAAVETDGNGQTAQLGAQLKELSSVGEAQAEAVVQNTQAVVENTVAQASSGGSTLSSVGNAVWSVFRSGLGLSPLVNAVTGLFGGGRQQPLAPLPVYTPPASIQFEGTLTSTTAPASVVAPELAPRGEIRAPQITIQVQALDSRSFLDHSDEIAQAVREAMLNSHSLNDVVSDLS